MANCVDVDLIINTYLGAFYILYINMLFTGQVALLLLFQSSLLDQAGSVSDCHCNNEWY